MNKKENISDLKLDKSLYYEQVVKQLRALVKDEKDVLANLANICAVLKEQLQFFWVGFYRVLDDKNLVLGPFQGPVACTRIAFGKGVCGTAFKDKMMIRVDDVDQFPGHIACNSASRSELVIPIFKNKQIELILDIDSDQLAYFNEIDEKYFNEIAQIIEKEVLN